MQHIENIKAFGDLLRVLLNSFILTFEWREGCVKEIGYKSNWMMKTHT
jgi:hypothetical protein